MKDRGPGRSEYRDTTFPGFPRIRRGNATALT